LTGGRASITFKIERTDQRHMNSTFHIRVIHIYLE